MLYWTAALLALVAAPVSASTPRRVKGLGNPAGLVASSGEESFRLPTSVVPLHYDLWLHPNPGGDFRYNGSVAIAVRALEATSNITFHAAGLEVARASVEAVSSEPGAALSVTGQQVDERRSFHTLTLSESLVAGRNYTLRLDFSGYHGTSMSGFYRSSYMDQDNNIVWLVTTQFEPTDARTAFPCFDEPALKATFRINIAVPEGLHARSNMPVARTEPDAASGRTWYHFEETPMPMSTYLVAFIVSNFTNYTEDYVSVWEQPAYQSQGRYAAGVGLRVIDAMENFTQVSYFLPKMDQVAVPDFSAGAMENYAMVTFREDDLLVEEGESESSYVQSVATVITHEFSHHWFGDLVGPRWWSYTWLNEGFATYFMYNLAALLEPSWRLDEQFVVDEMYEAFSADSSDYSHPMTVLPLDSPDVESMFDTISYEKGGSVIRMIEHVLTRDTFKKGLNIYLNAHGNSTATDQDLFDALSEQYDADFPGSSLDLQAFLESWVRQTGFPLLTVTRNYTNLTVTVSQERFLSGGGASDNGSLWWVPLTYATKSSSDFSATSPADWLNTSWKVVDGLLVDKDDWLVLNVQQTGFYRVNYDAANWALLSAQLNSGRYADIPPLNRAQIVSDAFNLAADGRLGYDVVVRLAMYLSREQDYVPWVAAVNELSTLDSRLRPAEDYYPVFKDFFLSLIRPAYEALGFDERPTDDHVTKLHRHQIVSQACALDYEPCLQAATSKFKDFLADQEANKVAPDLRRVVYCYGLRDSGYDAFSVLWSRYLTTQIVSEKSLLLRVLGCTGNETAYDEFLIATIANQTVIRSQDVSDATSGLLNRAKGLDLYISFLTKHYKDVIQLRNSTSYVLTMVATATIYISTQDQYTKLEQFLDEHQKELNLPASAATFLNSITRRFASSRALGAELARAIKQTYRLPSSLTPQSYWLNVRPHLREGNFTFDGELRARVRVKENTDRVVLYASDVVVDAPSVAVTPAEEGAASFAVVEQVYDATRQFFTVILNASLQSGEEYDVHLSYVGQLRDDMNGFYRSYYYVNGTKRWLAATQFESTAARRAFPSFDDPGLKATISLSIERPADYTSVSNMELLNTTDVEGAEGLKRDNFERTPPMSTYLLAFVVSDFARSADAEGNVTLWHRPDAESQATYALNVSRALLRHMEDFTGIQFALAKMDQAAIPDFSAGAMENWGLVTYRERMILFDEAVSTTADRQNIETTIAHEFSHQWFGDLVSPEWWTFTWLNEGFATYFEHFAAAAVERGWRLEDQFVPVKVHPSLLSDSYAATRAMTTDVYTPDECEAVFDYVSYGKAGSVIRMMSHFLTQEVFRKGLSLYLNARKFSTGRPEYLFAGLQSAADEAGKSLNVLEIMDSWTLQAGYPLVTVIRDHEHGAINVSQWRFFVAKSNSTSTDQTKWWVPLTYTTKSRSNFTNTDEIIWLNESSILIDDTIENDEWVIFNLQETGFYRVNYDEANWGLLTAQLNSDSYSAVHVLNRAQLVDDALNLARSGDLDYRAALNLTAYLSREGDYVPWYTASTALTFLNTRLAGMAGQDYSLFKEFVLSLVSRLYSQLGFQQRPEDDHTTRLLSSLVASWACRLEQDDCVNTATSLFSEKMANPGSTVIPADFSSTVYCTALRHGGDKEWQFLKNLYDNSTVGTEQVLILAALGCSSNESIINNYLNLSISADSGIRRQDAASVFSAVYANPAGVDISFKFLTDNYDKMSQFYGGMGAIGNILIGIADKLSTRDQVDKLRQFVDSKQGSLGRAQAASRQAVESAEANLRWLNQRGEVIAEWLREWKQQQPTAAPTTAPTAAPSTAASAVPTFAMLLAATACGRLLL